MQLVLKMLKNIVQASLSAEKLQILTPSDKDESEEEADSVVSVEVA